MKTKILIFVAVTAIVTLSFTFTSVKTESKKVSPHSSTSSNGNAPVGGFSFDEK